MCQYDYSKLLGRMKEQKLTQVQLAETIEMSEGSLNAKLKNKRDFKQDEIIGVSKVLNIPLNEIPDYFFAH